MPPHALLAGTPGRMPFNGHFRGVRAFGAARLAWAGRIGASASPVEGWAAAEAARDALAAITGLDRFELLRAAWDALGGIEARWLDRRDLSLLLVASDSDGVAIAGCGLAIVAVPGEGGLTPILPPGHPMLGEPGLPKKLPGFAPETASDRFVGVPTGVGMALDADIDARCGVHA